MGWSRGRGLYGSTSKPPTFPECVAQIVVILSEISSRGSEEGGVFASWFGVACLPVVNRLDCGPRLWPMSRWR